MAGGDSNVPSTSELYNPTAGTFAASATMTVQRSGHIAALLSSGQVLAAGGENSGGTLSSAELYACITTCPGSDNCGTIPDGCGGTVTCGPACSAPESCGGGGTANVCGCTPTVTTCPGGDNCGTISNGCGGMVSCGPACTMPNTCGGGGTPNVCGCTPITTCPTGDECGTVSNQCGGMISCGSCSGGATCTANHCVGGGKDGGSDSGSSDSGTHSDSGMHSDSGLKDSGKEDSGGGPHDSGLHGSGSDAADGGVDLGLGGSSSGGGCSIAARAAVPSDACFWLGLAGVVGLATTRRRTRRSYLR
jgi:hypothetical protein